MSGIGSGTITVIGAGVRAGTIDGNTSTVLASLVGLGGFTIVVILAVGVLSTSSVGIRAVFGDTSIIVACVEFIGGGFAISGCFTIGGAAAIDVGGATRNADTSLTTITNIVRESLRLSKSQCLHAPGRIFSSALIFNSHFNSPSLIGS